MKNITVFLLIVALLSLLSACNTRYSESDISDEVVSLDQSQTTESDRINSNYLSASLYPNIHEESKNYCVYTDDIHSGYYYAIYDNDGQLFDEGFCNWKFDSIEYVADNIVRISYGGSGGALFYAKYFDTDNGKVSKLYQMPLASSGDLIVYFKIFKNDVRLVVQDIFDAKNFYREFEDPRFSVSVFLTAGRAVLDKNNNSVSVTFSTPDQGEITDTYSW